MIFGATVCFIAGLLYPILSFVGGFLFLRFLHGFSTGFTPTGISAYVADIIPFQKRGEALGMQSLFGSLGMAAGPAIGGWIATRWPIDILFYTSAFTAILSILILIRLKETLKEKEPISFGLFKLKKDEIIEVRAILPSVVLFLSVFSFGTVLTIIPDFSVYLGIQNKGLFFAVFTISSLGIRLLAGKTSDRFGRILVLRVASVIMVIAMLTIAFAETKNGLLLSGVLFGSAVGMYSPTVAAWVIDLSLDHFRGRALATMYIALEAGIGIGAVVSGFLFSNRPENFDVVFMTAAGFAFIAFLLLLFSKKNGKLSLWFY
jgi:MFS family permease